jgi:hypothetical protein
MTYHFVLEATDFEFVYEFVSGSIGSIDPAELDQLARAAVLADFKSTALSKCNTGSVLRSGAREEDAADALLAFLALELAAARAIGVTAVPELPSVSKVYWRPVGPLHQIIGKVEKVSGMSRTWWSFPIKKGGTVMATAYLVYRMNYRAVS